MSKETVLYMIIPCYNEQEIFAYSSNNLKHKLEQLMEQSKISPLSKVCFVNDGSTDATWKLIQKACKEDEVFSGICLSHNEGHQNAVLAGLMTVRPYADIAISMDADLQDDIEAIDQMVDKYDEGYDIVYGVRNSRKKDSIFKRLTAEGYYKFLEWMGVHIIYNHSDFRLMDKRALDAMSEFKEVNLFLRGIVPMIGLKNCCVYYARKERIAGESKYPLRKMLAFAWQGITSLSTEPIKWIANLGLAMSGVSFLLFLYSLYRYTEGATIVGWTSLMLSVWFIGGIILFSLGIIGEYIGKTYLEVKHRPRYIISQFIDTNASKKKVGQI
jgi:glycosyltransferase involved in cell wall biosynthesis